jgi:peroxiredoxin
MFEPPGTLVSNSFNEGSVAPDFLIVDHHGDEVSLWQFYGQVILLDISTMWCAPCQELAGHTQETFDDYEDQGFMYLTVLHQDVEAEEPDGADLNEWAETFGIDAPVLADPFGVEGTIDAVRAGSYPAVFSISREMVIEQRLEEFDDITVRDAIEDIL